jgi:DNA (cytosine-5)-methyltransferase 1
MFKSKSVLNCVSINGIPLSVAEMFSGIGGTRLALEQVGFNVVVSSEINEFCLKTYKDNFGDEPLGDIRKIKVKDLPDFTVLAASTPCQSFSFQGNKKGLKDSRGQLIHDVLRIVDGKKPQVVFIENVKGMATIHNGRDLRAVLNEFKKRGYHVYWTVLKASDFGVPQNRERLYIVAFRENVPFRFPSPTTLPYDCGSVLEQSVHSNYYLTQAQIDHQIKKAAEYKEKGHGFGSKILDLDKPARTILKSSSSLLKNLVPVPFKKSNPPSWGVIEIENRNGKLKKFHLRKPTPRDCANLLGFPKSYKLTCSASQSYQQLGNSVAVPVIREIFKEILVSITLLANGVRVQNNSPKGQDPKPPKVATKKAVQKTTAQKKESKATKRKVVDKSANKLIQKLSLVPQIVPPPIYPKVVPFTNVKIKSAIQKWHSQDEDNHFMTPSWLPKAISYACPLELDASSSPEANLVHQFPRILTAEENALIQSWKVQDGHGVFVNPPYCKIGDADLLTWANKMADEYQANQQPIFALLPARGTETKWFHKLFNTATHVIFLKTRLPFNEVINTEKANFASALVIFGGHQLEPKKLEYLAQLGSCLETPYYRKEREKEAISLLGGVA